MIRNIVSGRALELGLGLLALALPACAGMEKPRLDPRVAAQVVVTKNEPPAGCAFLGQIKGSSYVGELSDAHTDVIRNAVLRGGNFVSVDMIERPVIVAMGAYMVQGRLFQCPQVGSVGQAVAQAPAAPPRIASDPINLPRAVCEPSCSNGFACEHGLCVAACNPLCGAGEICGADHACHANEAAIGRR